MAWNKPASISHTNDLSGYVSEWVTSMNLLKKPEPRIRTPRAVISYVDNRYDLSLMLSYLDNMLTALEETPRFDDLAYAQARAFLKVCYLLLRVQLDDVAGIIKYFYDAKEPQVGVPKSFNDLLKKADRQKLPEDLINVLQPTTAWFGPMRGRRGNLEHDYESLLISFKQDSEGKKRLGHFSTMGGTTKEYEDVREYFGSVLCGLQQLIDRLLDHFDAKSRYWYGFAPFRHSSTFLGIVNMPLGWAYEYGAYRHKDLHVIAGK
jgi:hypothetical protein